MHVADGDGGVAGAEAGLVELSEVGACLEHMRRVDAREYQQPVRLVREGRQRRVLLERCTRTGSGAWRALRGGARCRLSKIRALWLRGTRLIAVILVGVGVLVVADDYHVVRVALLIVEHFDHLRRRLHADANLPRVVQRPRVRTSGQLERRDHQQLERALQQRDRPVLPVAARDGELELRVAHQFRVTHAELDARLLLLRHTALRRRDRFQRVCVVLEELERSRRQELVSQQQVLAHRQLREQRERWQTVAHFKVVHQRLTLRRSGSNVQRGSVHAIEEEVFRQRVPKKHLTNVQQITLNSRSNKHILNVCFYQKVLISSGPAIQEE